MADDVILTRKIKEDTMVTFSIRIEKELAQKYDELSYKAHYSRNELINIALNHYIDVVKLELPIPDESSDQQEKVLKKKIPVKKDKK